MAGCPICEDLHHGAAGCPHSLVGVKLGKYEVSKFLAAGGMGAVYVGTHESLGSPVAVKTLHRAFLPSNAKSEQRRQLAETLVKRFTDEARRAASLRHPNIVRVEDLGVAPDGTPYLAMEYLEGVSLKDLLESDGPLPPERAADLIAQALDALEFAHKRNIIHRDIKPENLYVQHPGQRSETVKVLDFGIAKVVGEGSTQFGLTQTGHGAMGTFYYMSPEQAKDPRQVNASSDVFSVGASLFELLTGQTVLSEVERDLTTSGLMAVQFLHGVLTGIIEGRIQRHPSAVRPEVPAWLDSIVARSLAHEPADRFASAGEMAAALQARKASAIAAPRPAALAATAPSQEIRAATPPGEPRRSLPRTHVAPARAESVTPAVRSLGTTTAESAGERGVPVSQATPATERARSSRRLLLAAAGSIVLAAGGLAIALGGGGSSTSGSESAEEPTIDAAVVATRTVAPDAQPREPEAAPDAAPPREAAVAVKEAKEEVKPPAEAPAVGRLSIASKPSCKIFIDGRDTGKHTPARNLELPVGRHRVTLVNNADAIKESFNVSIRAGKTTRVTKNLSRPPPPPPPNKCDEVACLVDPSMTCCKKRPPPPGPGKLQPSRADITRGIGQIRGRVRACAPQPAAGLVKIRVKIAPSGAVASTSVVSSPTAALGACVARAVRRARFPRTQKGITFTFPFKFR